MPRPHRLPRPRVLLALAAGLVAGACGGSLYDADGVPRVDPGNCTEGTHLCSPGCKADTDADFCGAGCLRCGTAPAGGDRVCQPTGAGGTYECGFTCRADLFNTGAACERAVQVASGARHACARTEGGAVLCWGANEAGQLGRAGPGGPAIGLALPGGATAIATGGQHTCAIQAGVVRCWGANGSGQLGNGTTGLGGPTPVTVTLSGATALAAGAEHTCALSGDAVRCWGSNARGQLGAGVTGPPVTAPGAALLTGATQLSTFLDTTCALVAGQVRCWGANGSGQTGAGDAVTPRAPVTVPLPASALRVAVGAAHACVHLDPQALWCWGAGESMQLGNGGSAGALVPVQASAIDNANPPRHDGLLAAGGRFTCSSRALDQTLKCGGENLEQQVSIPASATVDQSDVTPGGALMQVSLGEAHGCAVVDVAPVAPPQLTVKCWGRNAEGQLGRVTGGAPDGLPSPIGP